ncbi:MAG: hypothetical protein ACI86X_001734 [Moritella sp.]|jgi:hypothetical protein
MEIQYRALMPGDSFQYRQVRLDSLKLHPECFGSGYRDQVKLVHKSVHVMPPEIVT